MNPFSRILDEVEIKEKNDAEVLGLARRHPWAFEIIVDRYQERFLKKARAILQNKEDAEDAVQETFVRIYRHADHFSVKEGAAFSSWAYTILTNTCFTLYQKKKRQLVREPYLEQALCDRVADEKASARQALDEYNVAGILTKMPAMLKTVLEKHFLLGFSQAEIALEEGVPVGTIKARVHRAKKEFRKLLEY